MVTPIVPAAIVFILGIVFCYYFNLGIAYFLAGLICSFLIAFFCFRISSKKTEVFLFAGIFLAGYVLCSIHLAPLSKTHIRNYISPWEVKLDGVIEQATNKQEYSSFIVKCEKINPCYADETIIYTVKGFLKVNYSEDEDSAVLFECGDRIRIYGNIEEPSGLKNPVLFNYKKYLRAKGIFAVMRAVKIEKISSNNLNILQSFVLRLGNYLKFSIDNTLSGDEGALLKGVMLGDKEEISQDLQDAFISTGLAHTLAVSGLNVTLVAFIFFFIFRKLGIPKKLCSFINIPIVIIYCLVTGANPPVLRATVFAIAGFIALMLERENDLANTIIFTAVVLLIVNPLSLFDASFQLSFLATYFIIALVPFLEKSFKERLPEWIIAPLSVSLAAQLGVFPLIVYYFNKVSFVSLIANLFVVPIQGIILALGFASALTFTFLLPLAKFFAFINFLFLHYFIDTVRFFSLWPFASINVATPAIFYIALYYTAFCSVYFKQKKKILFVIFSLAILCVWIRVLDFSAQNKLKIVFFDVGQGQSIFVHTPRGTNILIDAGNFNAGKYVLLPFLKERGYLEMNAVFFSHSHSDHVGGLLPLIGDLKVDKVFSFESEDTTFYSQSLWQEIHKNKIPFFSICRGDEINIGKGLKIEVLNPETGSLKGKDNNSLVLKLEYDSFSLLIPSDIRIKIEDELINEFGGRLSAKILQVPHHSSALALNKKFLKYVKPEAAVMQFGRFNPFGFPGHGVIEAYEKESIKVFRTDTQGAVEILTDGNTFSVKAFQ